MRSIFVLIAIVVLVSGMTSVLAQDGTPETVKNFVEALRLAAPDTGREDDGLYSDWQIKPDNIQRWSERCTGAVMSVEEFESNPIEARQVLECKMGEVLAEQFAASGDELTAVKRAAAWWMTGDPEQYASEGTSPYVERVANHYQELR